jgi:arginyl-tRNA synthetase
LHHIPFGRIQGISTRKGTLVFVEDLLAETAERALEKIRGGHALEEGTDEKEVAHKVGIGAIIFNDLRTRRIKDVEFSWDKVLSFEGETGPYLQYAYARIGRMLDKLGVTPSPDVDYTQLNQPEAWQIARMLANYPQVIRAAAAEYEPSYISTYLIDLASAFSTFYQNHRLMGSDPAFLNAAVTLVWCVRQVLHHGLLLLGVPPIERM